LSWPEAVVAQVAVTAVMPDLLVPVSAALAIVVMGARVVGETVLEAREELVVTAEGPGASVPAEAAIAGIALATVVPVVAATVAVDSGRMAAILAVEEEASPRASMLFTRRMEEWAASQFRTITGEGVVQRWSRISR
jgi:hypothetical protein